MTREFAGVLAAAVAFFTAVGTVLPVIPHYVAGPLHGGGPAIGFTTAAFFLGTLVARPVAGRISDSQGRRVAVVGGAAIMAVALAALGAAHNLAMLIALRSIQGFGDGAFYVGAVTAATDMVPSRNRGRAVSYFSVAVYAGLAIGPPLGEILLHRAGYTGVWGAAAVLAALAAVPAVRLQGKPGGIPAGRGRLLHPAGLVPGVVFGLGTFGYGAFASFMPLYALTLGLHGSAPVFGIYAGCMVVGRLLGARLPDKFGPFATARAGLVAMAAGLAVLGSVRTVIALCLGTAMFGVGSAFLLPSLLSLALEAAPEGDRAAVIGTVVAFFDIGQGAGAAASGSAVAAAGYGMPFGCGALAAIGGLTVLGRYRRGHPGSAPTYRPLLKTRLH